MGPSALCLAAWTALLSFAIKLETDGDATGDPGCSSVLRAPPRRGLAACWMGSSFTSSWMSAPGARTRGTQIRWLGALLWVGVATHVLCHGTDQDHGADEDYEQRPGVAHGRGEPGWQPRLAVIRICSGVNQIGQRGSWLGSNGLLPLSGRRWVRGFGWRWRCRHPSLELGHRPGDGSFPLLSRFA